MILRGIDLLEGFGYSVEYFFRSFLWCFGWILGDWLGWFRGDIWRFEVGVVYEFVWK